MTELLTIPWHAAFHWLNLRNNLGYDDAYCAELMNEYLLTCDFSQEECTEILRRLQTDTEAPIQQGTFEEYANTKKQIAELEAKVKELQPLIFQELMNLDLEKTTTKFGLFELIPKKTWTYPKQVKDLEARLKGLKKETEENGSATYETCRYLKFDPNKKTAAE
jgi:hypothetical protein